MDRLGAVVTVVALVLFPLLADVGSAEQSENQLPSIPPTVQLPLVRVVSVDGGLAHTCATTSTGRAFCWGLNDRGQLGSVEVGVGTVPSTRPVPVSRVDYFRGLTAGGTAALAAPQTGLFESHTCGLTRDFRVVCWGANRFGQLGVGDNDDRFVPEEEVLGGLRFRSVSAGGAHTCAVTLLGDMFCWGHNGFGQLGDGHAPIASNAPVRVATNIRFHEVSAGEFHTCGRAGTRVYCWGAGHLGQLGDARVLDSPVPAGPVVEEARDVSAAVDHSCAVRRDGGVDCWGRNDRAQLGVGSDTGPLDCGGTACNPEPTLRVETDQSFHAVSGGWFHTCGLTRNGRVFCWGDNEWGQLGIEGVGRLLTPLVPATIVDRVPPPGLLARALVVESRVRVLSAGTGHTCAVATGGSLFCWGYNAFGQLGDGTTDNRARPTRVLW